MAKKQRIVRIRYDHDRARAEELVNLARFIVIIVAILAILVVSIFENTLYFSFVMIIVLSAASIIPFSKFWKERKRRKADYADAKYIIDNGEKIIGKIVSMNVIKLDEEFTYDIEYEWHGGSHPVKMTTPTVMSSRMNITEKDLPLNVIIYATPNRAHAYAVIDPPIAKMKMRWFFRNIDIIIATMLIIAFVVVSLTSSRYSIMPLVLFCLCLLTAGISAAIRERKKK